MSLITRQYGPNPKGSKLTIQEMDGNLTYLEQLATTTSSYAQTFIVDPNGNNTTGNGSSVAPFQTIQKAHDYAVANISDDTQVVIKINAGTYAENLIVTRPNIHFIGPSCGVTKSTRISGTVNINTSSSVNGTANDMVSFENILISAGPSDSDVLTAAGTNGYTLTLNNVYIFTSSTTAKCVNIINTTPSGIKFETTKLILQNQSSSGTALNLSNTYFANIDLLNIYGGTGICINITTTNAVIYNTRLEKSGTTALINAVSSFDSKPSLILGNATLVNANANATGIDINNSTVNIAQVAFNLGSATGTGFAVKGVSGAVFINGNNVIVPGTNNKISTAITRVALGTALTPA